MKLICRVMLSALLLNVFGCSGPPKGSPMSFEALRSPGLVEDRTYKSISQSRLIDSSGQEVEQTYDDIYAEYFQQYAEESLGRVGFSQSSESEQEITWNVQVVDSERTVTSRVPIYGKTGSTTTGNVRGSATARDGYGYGNPVNVYGSASGTSVTTDIIGITGYKTKTENQQIEWVEIYLSGWKNGKIAWTVSVSTFDNPDQRGSFDKWLQPVSKGLIQFAATKAWTHSFGEQSYFMSYDELAKHMAGLPIDEEIEE